MSEKDAAWAHLKLGKMANPLAKATINFCG